MATYECVTNNPQNIDLNWIVHLDCSINDWTIKTINIMNNKQIQLLDISVTDHETDMKYNVHVYGSMANHTLARLHKHGNISVRGNTRAETMFLVTNAFITFYNE